MQTIACGHAHIFKLCKQLFVDMQTFSNRANKCVWTRKHFQTVQTIVCEQRKDLLLVDAPTWFPVDILKEQLAGFNACKQL